MNKPNTFSIKGLENLIKTLTKEPKNVDQLINQNKNVRFDKIVSQKFVKKKNKRKIKRKLSIEVKDRKLNGQREILVTESLVGQVTKSLLKKKENLKKDIKENDQKKIHEFCINVSEENEGTFILN